MPAAKLPLEELFRALRAHGLPLGVDDYLAALAALRAGFGVGTSADLERLCQTLWAKSASDVRLLRRFLGELLSPPAPTLPAPSEGVRPPTTAPAEAPPPEASPPGPGPLPGATVSELRVTAAEVVA